MDTIDLHGFASLLDVLHDRGFRVVGPVVRDGALTYDRVREPTDFPVGWQDEQEAGSYRLRRVDGPALFGCTVGPASLKPFLHPPAFTLWRAERTGEQGFRLLEEEEADEAPLAFVGVRPCDVASLRILDRVLLGDEFQDASYARRRHDAVVIAANCTRAGATCFCADMGAGPEVEDPVDLTLTEVVDQEAHYFVVETGSDRGAEILAGVPREGTTLAELTAARAGIEDARLSMGRHLDAGRAPSLLAESRDHPRWDDLAARCLGCANCTMVCPTCFCTTVEDVTDLAGHTAERRQRWDSCFDLQYSYIHGGAVRTSLGARYRHWITHKLSSWADQFDTLGCVGCGRCITWCPVGIDITAEIGALEHEPLPRRGGDAR